MLKLSPGGRGAAIAAVLLLVSGALLDYAVLAMLGVAAVAALMTAGVWVLFRPTLEVRREVFPQRVVVGEPASARLSMVNTGHRRSLPVVAIDRVGEGGHTIIVPGLGKGSSRTVTYQLPTARRAEVKVGPLAIDRVDPFGLVRVNKPIGDSQVFYVHPKRHHLVGLPSSLERSPEGPTGDAAAGTQVFHALREYVPGDDRRMIHWKTTAKTGTLMVRQHVDTTLPDVLLILDTTASRYSAESFEEAVEIVASLAELCCTQGFPVHLRTPGSMQMDRGTDLNPVNRILDCLAGVHTEDESDLTTLLQSLRSTTGGVGLVVVSRTIDTSEMSTLSPLARRFGSVTAVDLDTSAATPAATGVRSYNVDSAAEFARHWNGRMLR